MPFCDLKCRHAQWPDDSGVDGSGSCRTFLALYCRKRRRLVHKNAPCAEKEPAGDRRSGTGGQRTAKGAKKH